MPDLRYGLPVRGEALEVLESRRLFLVERLNEGASFAHRFDVQLRWEIDRIDRELERRITDG